ncbi:biotin/lipoyl-binding protein [Oleiphilus sp. HI0066]
MVPQVSGIVETVNITPNVAVKQGNILYTIENSAQQIALKKAEAALADA